MQPIKWTRWLYKRSSFSVAMGYLCLLTAGPVKNTETEER